MKPAPFKYVSVTTLGEVTDFLSEHAADARLLAGGQSLMPVLSMRLSRPTYLIDINRVPDLAYQRVEEHVLRIGAMSRHDELLTSELVREACPLLHEAIPYIGHTAIRYRGTIGGSIVHADPSAELPAVVVTLGAELVLRSSSGERTVPAEDFFLTYFTTAAEPEEILTEIRIPVQPSPAVAVCELARRHGDFAIAGVTVAIDSNADRLGNVRICGFGVDEVPRRLSGVEQLVSGQSLTDDLLREAGELARTEVAPESDMHASAEYRTEMTGVMTIRALRKAHAGPQNFDRGDERDV